MSDYLEEQKSAKSKKQGLDADAIVVIEDDTSKNTTDNS